MRFKLDLIVVSTLGKNALFLIGGLQTFYKIFVRKSAFLTFSKIFS